MKQINTIDTSRMSNGGHFDYMKTTRERFEADETAQSKIGAEITAFGNAVDHEDECLNVPQKSKLTAKIAAADAKRDALYAGLKSSARGFLKMPEGELLEAAQDVAQAFVEYDVDTKAALNRETGLLDNLVGELQGNLATQVATLGLTVYVANLKTANDETHQLLVERDNESATRIVGALKAARVATDEAYEAMIAKLNAYALIEGEENYATLIDQMNQQIVHFKREELGMSASTSTSSSTSPGSSSSSSSSESSSSGSSSSSSSSSGSGSSSSGSGSSSSSGDGEL